MASRDAGRSGSSRRPRLALLAQWLPRGHPLPDAVWAVRHRWVVTLLAVQAAALPLFALLRDYPVGHAVVEAVAPAALAALASWSRLGRRTRSVLAGTGLMVVSGMVVHLSGGAIEAHFHFFVMVPVVAMYESWWPFGFAIGYVLFQHGIVGTLNTETVYNHPAAQAHPWRWAGIHAALFAAACVACVVNWRLHEQARAQARELTYRVQHDPLTGLANRAVFEHRCDDALRGRRGTDLPPTVLLLDLNGFKSVNDTFGHHCGDLLLIEVARRLSGTVRAEDLVCRLGGDEFAVLLPATKPDCGEHASGRIVERLGEPYVLDGTPVRIDVSIGIATAEHGDDASALVRRADAAMYVAKKHRLGFTRLGEVDSMESVAG